MDALSDQLERLLTGLASEDMKRGHAWVYDGAQLFDDEVGHLSLPCALLLASDLASRLSQPDLGYVFRLGPSDRPGFPIVFARRSDATSGFLEVAPYVVHVFDRVMIECRADLSRLYEFAAGLLQPGGGPNPAVQLAPVGPNQEARSLLGQVGLQ